MSQTSPIELEELFVHVQLGMETYQSQDGHKLAIGHSGRVGAVEADVSQSVSMVKCNNVLKAVPLGFG